MKGTFNDVSRDVRHAVRWLRKTPGFTVVATLTLAAGIGVNTAVFSVVHAVLVKPLPYAEPDALMRVFEESQPETPRFPVSPGAFIDFRRQTTAFSGMAAYERQDLQLEAGSPEHLRAMRVTAGFFALLGHDVLHGREFTRDDETPGHSNVVILSHALWTRRFNADPAILGSPLEISGRVFEVVGVLPPGVEHVGGTFRSHPHGETVDAWWPRTLPQIPTSRDRQLHYLNVVARLGPGVTREQAEDDMRRVSARLAADHPETNRGWSSHVRPLREEIVGQSGRVLIAVMVAAAAALLIACLNVAGLLLGRAADRTVEMGVRTALGATRPQILRQLCIESAFLALLGGVAGIGVAFGALRVLVASAPAEIPRVHALSLDLAALSGMVGVTALTAFVFGLAPAIPLLRHDAARALRGGRGAPGGSQQRLRRFVVTAEVALAFALVVTTALLVRSLDSLMRQDPGFRPDSTVAAGLLLPGQRYPNTAAAAAFFGRLLERARALPGVESAGIGSDLPWTGYDENTPFGIVGRDFPRGSGPEARYHFQTPDFARALGMTLVAGRDFHASDRAEAAPVVLVNEATARQFWGDPHKALDARLNVWGRERTVVGVVGNVGDTPGADTIAGALYFPQAQNWFPQEMFIAVRSSGDPSLLAEPLRAALRDLDPGLSFTSLRSLDDIAGAAVAARRFTLTLVGTFGALALLLALLGIYGVTAQAVRQRTREFGVRQALGARPADILRLVMRGAALLAMLGVASGLLLMLPMTQAIRSLLFKTSPLDPVSLGVVSLALVAVSLGAAYLPARRALHTQLTMALRQD